MLEARFYKPNSAKAVVVNPRVEEGCLVVTDDWSFPLERIELEISGHAEDKIMIRCVNDGAALLFDNANILEILSSEENPLLRARCTLLQSRLKGRKGKEFKYWTLIAAVCAVVLTCGILGFNVFLDWATWHFDPKLEAEIGKSASKNAQWESHSPQLERLNRIGGKLASHLDSSTFPFSFHVKKVKDINAVAYPGGIIEVNQGLIDIANDDELAGILGHEMGHVLHHDTLRKILRDMGAKSVLLMISGVGSDSMDKLLEAASVAQKFDAIRFSRAQEADADILGVDLAIKSGYDGDGLVHFFERLEKTGGGENKLLALLSDHPLDSERIAAVKKEIARLHSKPQ